MSTTHEDTRMLPIQKTAQYRHFLQVSVLSMFLTSVALLISLGLTSLKLQVAANDITKNAAPSVIEVANANVALVLLAGLLEDRIDQTAEPVPRSSQIHAEQEDLNDTITRYLALPMFPGEEDLAPKLRDGLSSVNRITHRIETLPPEAPASVRNETKVELKRAIDDLSVHLSEAGRLNAKFLSATNAQIENVRRRALPLAVIINLSGFIASSTSVIIAFFLVRRFAANEAAALAKLQNRATELEAFSAHVAHDLLSPLMTTSLAIVLAREKLPVDDQKTRTQLTRAETSLIHVRTLVEGLLEFARADVQPITGASTHLDEVIRDVEATLLPLAERDAIELVVEPFESKAVAASRGVVASMVGNYLQNSMRAVTKCDVRRVALRVRDEDTDAKKLVRVEVEDTGGGVDPDIEPLLFQPHARNIRGKASPGMGLGLATVKKLAERHGGSAGFCSQSGVGSTFWFTLPRVE